MFRKNIIVGSSTPYIRPLDLYRDMESIVQLDKECFAVPWTREEFQCCLHEQNCIGLVADNGNQVVGFIIYDPQNTELHVVNVAVAPNMRRQGIGKLLMSRLVHALYYTNRAAITLEVRETNVPAQLFFQSNGFKETHILRNHYEDTGEDGYHMRYDIPTNRFTRYFLT
jgi:ribosomal-protein-alanine N-acetyltransferase